MDEDWDTTLSSPVKTAGCTGTDFGRGRGFLPTLIKEKKPGGLSDAVDDWKDDSAGTDTYSSNETEFGGRGLRGGFSNGNSRSYRSNKFRDENNEDRNANFEDTDFDGSGRGDGSGRSRGRGRGGRGGPRGGRGDNRSRRYDDDNGNGNLEDGDGGFNGGSRRGGRGRGRGGGSRGGRGGSNIDEEGDGEEASETKPRELYIPPEPEDDEEKMFNSGISSGINFDKYDNINVKVTGEGIPRPIETFDSSGLRQFVLDNVKKCGYTKPTPVQKNAIPIIMDGRDLMACAQTGSGKTAAFLLPIINVLLSDPKDLIVTSEHCEPHAIIMSPTRELALQIFTEARKFAHGSIIKTVVAYGGTAAYHQAQQVMRGCHILVATPGRLNDFVGRGRIKFSSVRFFILDEADRMLDMGFLPDIERMMDHDTMVPKEERQTLMFSATFPEEIQRLAGRFLNNYLFLAVGIVGGACADVEQNFYQVSKFQKRNKLTELLNEEGQEKTLVFVETKRNADFIAAYLSERDYPTTSIHGDRLQRERELALQDFKSGRMNILVATAVAARGLDIKNVAHVINYDMPSSIDEYVHRIGRTGRVGNRGKATSFYDSDSDSALAKDLVKILKQAGQDIPSWLEEEAANSSGISLSKSSNFGGRDFRKFDNENSFTGGGSSNIDQQCNEPDEEW